MIIGPKPIPGWDNDNDFVWAATFLGFMFLPAMPYVVFMSLVLLVSCIWGGMPDPPYRPTTRYLIIVCGDQPTVSCDMPSDVLRIFHADTAEGAQVACDAEARRIRTPILRAYCEVH